MSFSLFPLSEKLQVTEFESVVPQTAFYIFLAAILIL